MGNIKLLKCGNGPRAYPSAASPRACGPTPLLGREWWTAGYGVATAPLDERCEALYGDIKRAYGRVRVFSDPKGTPFAEIEPEGRLPVALLQGILRVPDEFAQARIVLRKVRDQGTHRILVCDSGGQTVGLVEPCELLDLDYWLEWCAHWLLASCGISPRAVADTLEQRLPQTP
jgi:hypothetical protein